MIKLDRILIDVVFCILSLIFLPIVQIKMFFKRTQKSDIIIILFYKKLGRIRLQNLINNLQNYGLRVVCISQPQISYILNLNFLPALNFKIGILKILVKKYSPKIVIWQNDRIPKNVYDFLKKKGIISINIAHGIVGTSDLFNSLNYDYYFVYGKSSYENLLKNQFTKGTTKVILAGPPFYNIKKDENYQKCLILISGSYFSSKYPQSYVIDFFKALDNLINDNPNFLFIYKPHIVHRTFKLKWLEKKYLFKHKNLLFVNKDISIIQLLKHAKLNICQVSNTALDAAICNVPFIIFDSSILYTKKFYAEDVLYDTNFFMRATDYNSLKEFFYERLNNTDEITKKLNEFVNFHISRHNSVDYISECIKKIYFNDLSENDYLIIKK